ncbi:MAG: T9SS type A sorting domain-containing protein, partial [Saprospiraceae bacterium]|nr:T9SS type A sorting domain-containing protein [Saprospiraceae bacterium]
VIWEKAYRLKEENTPDTGNSLFVGEQYVFAVGGGTDSTGKTLGVINVYDKVKGDEIYTILIEQDSVVSIEKCIVVKNKIYYTGYSHNNLVVNIITGAFLLPKITSSSHVFLDSNLKVFPNPTVDQLNIDNIDPSVFNYLEVASISGQVMMRSAIKENTVTVDMSAYPAGVYLISMQGKGVVITKKIIKAE